MEKTFVKVCFINECGEVVKTAFVEAKTIIEAVNRARKWYKEEKKTFEYRLIGAEYLNIVF